jgi:hypothetical protein
MYKNASEFISNQELGIVWFSRICDNTLAIYTRDILKAPSTLFENML